MKDEIQRCEFVVPILNRFQHTMQTKVNYLQVALVFGSWWQFWKKTFSNMSPKETFSFIGIVTRRCTHKKKDQYFVETILFDSKKWIIWHLINPITKTIIDLLIFVIKLNTHINSAVQKRGIQWYFGIVVWETHSVAIFNVFMLQWSQITLQLKCVQHNTTTICSNYEFSQSENSRLLNQQTTEFDIL